jgi:hypothetical protein
MYVIQKGKKKVDLQLLVKLEQLSCTFFDSGQRKLFDSKVTLLMIKYIKNGEISFTFLLY